LSIEKKKITCELARTFKTNQGYINAMKFSLDREITIKELVEKYNKVTPEDKIS